MIAAQAKLIALCAALVAGLSLAWFLHAGSLRAERDDALRAAGAAATTIQSLRESSDSWETATLDAHRALAQCQDQWAEATVKAARAEATAEQGRREAQRVLAAFSVRNDARGAECSAALAVLDTACAELGGY